MSFNFYFGATQSHILMQITYSVAQINSKKEILHVRLLLLFLVFLVILCHKTCKEESCIFIVEIFKL